MWTVNAYRFDRNVTQCHLSKPLARQLAIDLLERGYDVCMYEELAHA